MRRAAGGVVASRAERRTKTLPATETFRTSPSTRHGRGSSLPGRPAPQLPRKEDGLRKNRLYLALVAVRRRHCALASAQKKAGDSRNGRYLVDPASSYMLVSKIKPCRSKYRPYTAKLRMAH
jgi:hypothetical protein